MFKLKFDLIGKACGNFRPKYEEPERSHFLDHDLEYQINTRNINIVFAPHCTASTNVAKLGDENQITLRNWMIRTPPGVDGGMVTEPNTAIAIFNADCPVIILFDKTVGKLAMLHAGFRCLVPKDKHGPNIIESAFNNFDFDLATTDAFIGFGAGPCCYGVSHYDEVLKRELYDNCIQVAKNTKGPRFGQLSLNFPYLIRNKLLDCGVRDGAISYDTRCTACAGREDDGEGTYHSNIYDGKDGGRNLVLAWFK